MEVTIWEGCCRRHPRVRRELFIAYRGHLESPVKNIDIYETGGLRTLSLSIRYIVVTKQEGSVYLSLFSIIQVHFFNSPHSRG